MSIYAVRGDADEEVLTKLLEPFSGAVRPNIAPFWDGASLVLHIIVNRDFEESVADACREHGFTLVTERPNPGR